MGKFSTFTDLTAVVQSARAIAYWLRRRAAQTIPAEVLDPPVCPACASPWKNDTCPSCSMWRWSFVPCPAARIDEYTVVGLALNCLLHVMKLPAQRDSNPPSET